MGKIREIVDKLIENIGIQQLEYFVEYQLENGIEEDDIPKKFNTFLRDNIAILKYGESPFGKTDDFEVREFDVHEEVVNPEKRTYEVKQHSNVEEISYVLEDKVKEVMEEEPKKGRKRTIKTK